MKQVTLTTLSVIAGAALVLAAPAHANTNSSSTRPKAPGIEFRAEKKIIIEDSREKKVIIRNSSSTPEEKRAAIQATNKARVEALKENRNDMKAAIEARQAKLKAEIEVRKAENKIKLEAKKKENVQKRVNKIFAGMDTQIARLTSADAKISARINAIATTTNISNVTSLYTAAQLSLSKAKTDLAAAKVVVNAQLTTETSSTTIKALISTAETSIKASIDAYKKVLEALKPFIKPQQ